MLDSIRAIFGTYTPMVGADGSVLTGLASINFEYVTEVVLFSICLVSVFKIIGVVLRRL